MIVSVNPKGLAAARYLRALSIGKGNPVDSAAFAAGQGWRDTPSVAPALKAAVDTLDTSNAEELMRPVAVDFAEFLRPQTIIGRVQGFWRVPFNVRMVWMTGGATAHWVGSGAPKPLTAAALTETTSNLGPAKVAATAVVTDDLLRMGTAVAEATLLAELGRAGAEALDVAFIDPANAGDADKPASVTFGSPTFVSTGATLAAIDSDLGRLVDDLSNNGSNLGAAVWIMRPTTAANIARVRGTGGAAAFPSITAKGGMLLGIPVLTSENVPIVGSPGTTSIVLLNADGVALADDGEATFDVARHASVQMDDAPSSGAHQLVSLWQLNMVGLRAERIVNWRVRRPGTAATLTGVTY